MATNHFFVNGPWLGASGGAAWVAAAAARDGLGGDGRLSGADVAGRRGRRGAAVAAALPLRPAGQPPRRRSAPPTAGSSPIVRSTEASFFSS